VNQPWLGYALLGGAQLCAVGRNGAARCLALRNARRLHRPQPVVAADATAVQARRVQEDVLLGGVADSEPQPQPGSATDADALAALGGGADAGGQEHDGAAVPAPKRRGAEHDGGEAGPDRLTAGHLFRGLDDATLSKLDRVFEDPLYLHRPIGVGSVATWEIGQLGGNLALAPAAALA
jgi:hypothetical protein